jgi:hypothetical protein
VLPGETPVQPVLRLEQRLVGGGEQRLAIEVDAGVDALVTA